MTVTMTMIMTMTKTMIGRWTLHAERKMMKGRRMLSRSTNIVHLEKILIQHLVEDHWKSGSNLDANC